MGVLELLFQYLTSCFHWMKRPNEDVKLSPMHLVRGFQSAVSRREKVLHRVFA